MPKKYSCAIISSQAFSLVNFRGPLIRDLVASGVAVYALAPDFDDGMRARVSALGAKPVDFSLVRTGKNPVSDVIDTFKLVLLLRHLQPDVTLGYFIKPVIFGTVAAWLARVPRRVAMIEGLGYVFTDSEDSQHLRQRALRTIVGSLYRFALARAHKVIFLNIDDLNDFVGAGFVSQSKVVKLGGIGVDLAEWPIAAPVVAPVTFILAARLLREKGIVEYAEAARIVKAIHPQIRFILLGGLDPNPHCLGQTQIEALVALGGLEWPGHVEVRSWLAQSSVYVLPSYREGVPRSTQEAMAMGRAVITTDVPGCRETVNEGVNGFLVPVRDSAALAKAMLQFIDNPALIEKMGIESRRMAESLFDVRKINLRQLKLLDISGARQDKYLGHKLFRQDRPPVPPAIQIRTPGLLTISIVSHQQFDLISDLLCDLETYCLDTKFEVILTLNLNESITVDLNQFSYPIKLVRNAKPKGFSFNQNQAFKLTEGAYFCVLNPDIRLKNNPFNSLLECLENQSFGVVAPLVFDDDGVLEDSARRFPSPFKILCKFFGGCKGYDYKLNSSPIYPDWVAGMFMVFSRVAFNKVNGFDERYFLYYEDVDVCGRLRLEKYKVLLCQDAKVIHYARRSSHQNFRYFRWHVGSMIRFFCSPVYWQLNFRSIK